MMDIQFFYFIVGILFYIVGIFKNLWDTWNTNE